MQHFVKSDFRGTALPAVPYLAARVAAAQDYYIIASQSERRETQISRQSFSEPSTHRVFYSVIV